MRLVHNDPYFHGEPTPALPRFASVELEIAYYDSADRTHDDHVLEPCLHNWCDHWFSSIGTDGSINTEDGVEIRTAPARGAKFSMQISQLCDVLTGHRTRVNRTCGLHVHVDARNTDLTGYERTRDDALHNTLQMWREAESWAFSIMPASRRGNSYCRPLFTMPGRGTPVDMPAGDFQYAFENWCSDRYFPINMQSLRRHGTIEFRLHNATTSERHITAWARWCCAFVNLALTRDASEFRGKRNWSDIVGPQDRATLEHRLLKFSGNDVTD